MRNHVHITLTAVKNGIHYTPGWSGPYEEMHEGIKLLEWKLNMDMAQVMEEGEDRVRERLKAELAD